MLSNPVCPLVDGAVGGSCAWAVAWAHGPGAHGVELGVSFPVLQGLARLAGFFKGQGQVVVGVSVSGRQSNGRLVRADGIRQAPGFVQHVAQVKVRQRVARVYFDRFAIIAFRQHVIMAVVAQCPQVDVRRCMIGVQRHALLVGVHGFVLRLGVFFQTHTAGEEITGGLRRADGVDLGRLQNSAVSKVHYKLPGQGFHRSAAVAIDDPRSPRKRAGLQQRILHARNLLLHGAQGIANHGRTHLFSAQVAQFLDLQEIKKGIELSDWKQSGFLPADKLARRDAKNPEDVLSTISFHFALGSTPYLQRDTDHYARAKSKIARANKY